MNEPVHVLYAAVGALIGALLGGVPVVWVVARNAVRNGLKDFRRELDAVKASIEDHHKQPGHNFSLTEVERLRTEVGEARAYVDARLGDGRKLDAAAYGEMRHLADRVIPALALRVDTLERKLKDCDEVSDAT